MGLVRGINGRPEFFWEEVLDCLGFELAALKYHGCLALYTPNGRVLSLGKVLRFLL